MASPKAATMAFFFVVVVLAFIDLGQTTKGSGPDPAFYQFVNPAAATIGASPSSSLYSRYYYYPFANNFNAFSYFPQIFDTFNYYPFTPYLRTKRSPDDNQRPATATPSPGNAGVNGTKSPAEDQLRPNNAGNAPGPATPVCSYGMFGSVTCSMGPNVAFQQFGQFPGLGPVNHAQSFVQQYTGGMFSPPVVNIGRRRRKRSSNFVQGYAPGSTFKNCDQGGCATVNVPPNAAGAAPSGSGIGQPSGANGGFGQPSGANGGFGQPSGANGGFGQPSGANGGFGQPSGANGGFGQAPGANGGFGPSSGTTTRSVPASGANSGFGPASGPNGGAAPSGPNGGAPPSGPGFGPSAGGSNQGHAPSQGSSPLPGGGGGGGGGAPSAAGPAIVYIHPNSFSSPNFPFGATGNPFQSYPFTPFVLPTDPNPAIYSGCGPFGCPYPYGGPAAAPQNQQHPSGIGKRSADSQAPPTPTTPSSAAPGTPAVPPPSGSLAPTFGTNGQACVCHKRKKRQFIQFLHPAAPLAVNAASPNNTGILICTYPNGVLGQQVCQCNCNRPIIILG